MEVLRAVQTNAKVMHLYSNIFTVKWNDYMIWNKSDVGFSLFLRSH